MSKHYFTKYLRGRFIFERVIPTVCTLENLFKRLDTLQWKSSKLRSWEKPIYNAYRIKLIEDRLSQAELNERKELIKDLILNSNGNELGAHPICIYLIAYFASLTHEFTSHSFYTFVVNNNISSKRTSANAIWSVGMKDAEFLDLIDPKGNVKDEQFFNDWTCESNFTKSDWSQNQLSTHEIVPIPRKSSMTQDEILKYFLKLPNEEKTYLGTNSFIWSTQVCEDLTGIPKELNVRFYRDDLFDYCSKAENLDVHVLLAILSWGGMNRKHGQKLFQQEVGIMDIVCKLRSKVFKNRIEAFEYIQNQRSAGMLKGLGIGYFTKLICFLHPELNGYIMDQWVGKSVNLLTGTNLIDIDRSGWVTDSNNARVYESFCSFIDELGSKLGMTGFKTEEKLFSFGGRSKGTWRRYVVDHY